MKITQSGGALAPPLPRAISGRRRGAAMGTRQGFGWRPQTMTFLAASADFTGEAHTGDLFSLPFRSGRRRPGVGLTGQGRRR